MIGDDEIEALSERFFGREAEQRRRGAVPATDESRTIGVDDGVAGLIDHSLGESGGHIHKQFSLRSGAASRQTGPLRRVSMGP